MKEEKRHPWMKWYPADFRSEPTLRMVCRAARSFWVDALGLMHEATPYGHLVIGGVVPSVKQLASVLGDSERDVARWIAELKAANVCSVTAEGVIFSRRMVRDKAKSIESAAFGQLGGNPNLKPPDKPGVNPPDNGGDKAQRPEAKAISQAEASASALAASPRRKPKHALPSDWAPKDRHRLKASERGLDLEDQAERARNWAAAQDARMADWDRFFDNWLMNAREAGNGRRQQQSSGESRFEQFMSAAAASARDAGSGRAARPDFEGSEGDDYGGATVVALAAARG